MPTLSCAPSALEKRTLSHLELLRVLAILLVVWNHSPGYLYYLEVRELPLHWLLMAVSALSKIAVPLFFMISGALLLPKEERLSELLRRRVLRCALALLLFSLLSHLLDLYREGQAFSLYFFLSRVYAYRLVYNYWFLYAYLGFLLALPFLRHIAQWMDGAEWGYLLALMLLTQGLDLLQALFLREELFAESSFALFPLGSTVFFPLLGYYLEHRLPERCFRRPYLYLSLLAAALALLLMTAAAELASRRGGDWSGAQGELYFGRLSFVVAAAVYFQAKLALDLHSPGPRAARVLALLGSCSFGIYLLHHFVMPWARRVTEPLFAALGVFAGSWAQTLLVCLAAGLVTWLLKRLPGLRELL